MPRIKAQAKKYRWLKIIILNLSCFLQKQLFYHDYTYFPNHDKILKKSENQDQVETL